MGADFRAFIEIVFLNDEDTVQSWHLDGYSFFVLGMDGGQWTQASIKEYNLFDTVSRCTTQVYPQSWTAIRVPLDNVGTWNLRSKYWARQYLGQQFYLRVYSPAGSFRDEYSIPNNALIPLCWSHASALQNAHTWNRAEYIYLSKQQTDYILMIKQSTFLLRTEYQQRCFAQTMQHTFIP